jgi:protein involved in polysaccharide export with SLBB domain
MEEVLKMMKEQQQQMLMDFATSTNNSNIATIAEQTQKQQLEKFQVPDYYSVGIELDKAIEKPKSDANIVLREGDRLIIPKYNGTVKVSGAVMYNNTIAYSAGKSAKYYINAAGGFAQNAKKSNAYIIYMNGMVSKLSGGAKVQPGCEIVIPTKINRKKSVAETMSIVSSATSMAAMIATIANIMK